MLALQNLNKIFKENHFKPNKKLGQNFLVSSYTIDKIIASCNLTPSDIVLEIGAGAGNLTEHLVEKCKKVIAVEKDKNLIAIMKDRLSCGNLEIINDNILKFKIKDIAADRKIKVIGNLPYYISSDIIKYILENRDYISSFYCSLQKEFAERIIEKPGSKKYGRLTIFVNYYANSSILFDIPSAYFYPPPNVDSCFMKIYMRSKPLVKVQNEKFFFSLIKAGFSKRRKKLVNCLYSLPEIKIPKEELSQILEKCDINPDVRAEDLSIEEFACLAESILKVI